MIREKEVKIEDRYIRWFSDLSKEDVKLVGGKAANLGEMSKIGMPVPQGFAISALGYNYFLEETGLKEKIYEMLKIDVEDTEKLEEAAKKVRELIEKAELPEDLEEEIIEAYEVLSFDEEAFKNISSNALDILKRGKEGIFVAVRSSATSEDSEKASFAGQQESFLNIKGSSNLIEAIKKCFASLFTARSVYYRVKKKFRHEDVLIAVIVQIMISSDKSGVIFSREPVTNEENVVIEAVFGLGEGIVSGRIQPDNYLVNREMKILDKKIADKKIAITRDSSGETITAKLTEDRSKQQVLSEQEIRKLANYALKLERHYNIPQDIEFAISSNEIYIVQTRPVTTLHLKKKKEEVEGKLLVEGLAASPGIGSGEVKLILDLRDLSKVRKGDVLLTKMTNPDMVVSMQKCSAIITDEGGITAHAAIVSREMGIPCVVGTKNATTKLKDGMIVTVDGFNGKVYEGKLEELKAGKVEILPIIETETKIKVMVDLPDFASRAAKTNCKEVGLLRLEGIIAESGKHPFYFLGNKKINEYEEIIFKGIKKIAEYFDELWIRTSDIRSDEFRNLEGAEGIEVNPMLGMHGIRAGLKFKEVLIAELRAMKKLAGEKGKKVGVMMPQIISVDEVLQVKRLLEEINAKLDENKNLKLGVMIETPAAVQIIEELCKEGISFISFGTNDLTQYTLAIDRGNEKVQYLYDEMNPAVLRQLAYVIKVCKKYKVETSICGQAGSKKEMVKFLVRQGIDSISVNADKAYEISVFVKDLENKGLRGSALDTEIKETPEEKIEEKIEEVKEEIKEEKKDEFGRKLYEIKCFDCGKNAEVPFKPEEGIEVYCKECYKLRKQTKQKKPEKIIEKVKEAVEKAEDNVKEIGEEIKEKAEEEKEAVKEEWQDLEFGIDVFASQEKQENKKEEVEEIDKVEEEKVEEKQKPMEEEEVEEEEKTEDESKEEFYQEQAREIIEGEEGKPEEIKETEEEVQEKPEEAEGTKEKQEEVLDIF